MSRCGQKTTSQRLLIAKVWLWGTRRKTKSPSSARAQDAKPLQPEGSEAASRKTQKLPSVDKEGGSTKLSQTEKGTGSAPWNLPRNLLFCRHMLKGWLVWIKGANITPWSCGSLSEPSPSSFPS